MVLTIGSYAMKAHELRQVRKEAAVSEYFRVPQGSLVRANYMGNVRVVVIEGRCTTLILYKYIQEVCLNLAGFFVYILYFLTRISLMFVEPHIVTIL